ncbi:MAG TPA: xanthine dehydrogenase family protein subunit M [Candidatus Binatia bacterium]|jgi:carbon-monoxide dehydrogenase medium subunit
MKFDLLEPATIGEAAALLSARADARVLAGGQSLLLMIRSGLVRPGTLVSLNAVARLAEIAPGAADGLSIGALATHASILTAPLVRERAPLLAMAVERIGSTPVRNFGTLGGNLCHNEMGGDPPPALLALEAEVECAGPRGRRRIPLADFFTDYFSTALAPDEILTTIDIPRQPRGSRAVYLKHAMRPGDLAIVGVAALLEMDGGVCRRARLALGGVGPVAFRALEAEKLLGGARLDEDAIDAAADAAAAVCDPIDDAHAPAEYRRKMARVFVRRALRRVAAGEDR